MTFTLAVGTERQETSAGRRGDGAKRATHWTRVVQLFTATHKVYVGMEGLYPGLGEAKNSHWQAHGRGARGSRDSVQQLRKTWHHLPHSAESKGTGGRGGEA
jgi:hypothetical protein